MKPDSIAANSISLNGPLAARPPANVPTEEMQLRSASRALETSFIAEMLKSTGLGKTRDSFGGGAGEEGFASFLVTAQAEKIVESGGFGLAEQIFQSLVKRSNTDG